jgi:hypothetical protein
MTPVVRHYGRVHRGKKIYYNQPLFDRQMESLEGKEFVEVIKEKHKKPSLDQHGYYRGGILGTCLQTEYFAHFLNEEKVHSFFADLFLKYSEQVITPKESYFIYKIRSTADLSRKEYSEFIEKVKGWCIENDIVILDAESYESKYYKTINKDDTK